MCSMSNTSEFPVQGTHDTTRDSSQTLAYRRVRPILLEQYVVPFNHGLLFQVPFHQKTSEPDIKCCDNHNERRLLRTRNSRIPDLWQWVTAYFIRDPEIRNWVWNWFTTSSPHYPRGHGLVERHLQTIKRLTSKCREDGTDINMAILNLRSTPLNQNTPSPAELLNNRRYRSNLPVRTALPQNYEQIKEQFERNQTSSTEYYNQHTRTLSELPPGQHVRVQDPVTRLWKPATVVEWAHTPRSYLIEKEDGSQLRRSRQHLRETAEKPVSHPPVDVTEPPGRSLEPAHQPRPPDVQSRPTRANSAGTEFPITRANSAGTKFPITRANQLDEPMDFSGGLGQQSLMLYRV